MIIRYDLLEIGTVYMDQKPTDTEPNDTLVLYFLRFCFIYSLGSAVD